MMPLWVEELVCRVLGHDDHSFTIGEYVFNVLTSETTVVTVAIVACRRCGKVGESAGEAP